MHGESGNAILLLGRALILCRSGKAFDMQMLRPRSIGDALKGTELGDLWKYRVGDYRIIASIEDKIVCILVVRIGNRREVYR